MSEKSSTRSSRSLLQPGYQEVLVADIVESEEHPPIDKDRTAKLARSIEEIGCLQPPALTTDCR